MFTLLTKIFIKNYQNYKDSKVRNDYGTLASIFGIVSNFIICAMKFIVGLLFSIISITADAVNNLADASSSFVSLIGIKLSNKPADNDHPFGHARIEYIAGFVVSILIAALGIVLIYSSIVNIIDVATGAKEIVKMESLEFYITIATLSLII